MRFGIGKRRAYKRKTPKKRKRPVRKDIGGKELFINEVPFKVLRRKVFSDGSTDLSEEILNPEDAGSHGTND